MVKGLDQKTNSSPRRGNKRKSALSKRQASLCGKNIKNKKLFYFLPFCLIFILCLLQIYLANGLATRGKQLRDNEGEVNLLEEENKRIKSEIASFGGLAKLTIIAEEKGFVKNPPIINVTTKIPVALNP